MRQNALERLFALQAAFTVSRSHAAPAVGRAFPLAPDDAVSSMLIEDPVSGLGSLGGSHDAPRARSRADAVRMRRRAHTADTEYFLFQRMRPLHSSVRWRAPQPLLKSQSRTNSKFHPSHTHAASQCTASPYSNHPAPNYSSAQASLSSQLIFKARRRREAID